MKEASFYRTDENHRVICELCPHGCKIPEDGLGRCGARKNIEGALYSLNYGKLSAIHVDPITKKPLYHFMEGTYTFSVGSYGCNFSCVFCQNYTIAQEVPVTRTVSPEEVVEMTLENNLPSISYTYNEPTVFYEFVMDTAKLAKEKGLKNILVTNGYINPEPLSELIGYIDAMNIDLKSFNDETYRKMLGGSLDPVLKTIEYAHDKTHVEITTLVVTGMNDTMEELEQIFKWIADLNDEIPLHLSRYFPMHKYHEPATDIELLFKAKALAEKYLKHVHLGNV